MKLFRWNNPWTEIFICVWKRCPTGCPSCYKTRLSQEIYPLEKVQKQIDISHELSDSSFSYFLYGTDIFQVEIIDIIRYITSIWRKYRLQIPLEAEPDRVESFFLDTNTTHEMVISKKIEDIASLKQSFMSIAWFYNQKKFRVNYDLLIPKIWIPTFESLLKIRFIQNDDLTYSAQLWKIMINIRELYVINPQKKCIDQLAIKTCFSNDAFEVYDDHIEIMDHFEIDENLDICFHNPLCYIGKNKIANMSAEAETIIHFFKKYKYTYLKNLEWDFKHNCYTCIKHGFQYDSIP